MVKLLHLEDSPMRYVFQLLALTLVILLGTSSDALAQRGGYNNRGNSGYNGGNRSYAGQTYYNNPNAGYRNNNFGYNGYGNNNFNRTGFGIQIYSPYNSGYNTFGNNRGLYGNSYGYYTPSYSNQGFYQTSPSYSVGPTTTYSVMPATYSQVSPTLLMPAAPVLSNDPSLATIRVIVPTGDAQVWFADTMMTQTGTSRTFQSTPLDSNKNYFYEVRARWMSNGQTMDQTRKVAIQAGQVSQVDFLSAMPEPFVK
jgi:uncharacterized protein (TIGR03000 family)